MLDKGLNNPNFEAGHSLNIYREAKKLHKNLEPKFGNDKAFIWAGRIIKTFEEAQKTGLPKLESQHWYEYSEEERLQLSNFILRRTSCRNFIDKNISDEILEKIIYIAVDAPNGCCRQTTRYHVIKSISKNIAGITNFNNIQGLAAVTAEASCYSLMDKNLQYVDAALSAENFILAASIYGIYGTMCNFFQATPSQVQNCKTLLSIPDSQNIVLFIAFGYPSVIPEKPQRQNIDTFYSIVN